MIPLEEECINVEGNHYWQYKLESKF